MLDSARAILSYVGDMDEERFTRDEKTRDAVLRRLEILGEAAKRLREEFKRQHPEIDWVGPAGMRDVLIHQYRRVDVGEVWRAVTEDIPRLLPQLAAIVPDQGE
jgi:uncharacterized protein with HEPN domain